MLGICEAVGQQWHDMKDTDYIDALILIWILRKEKFDMETERKKRGN